LFQKRIKRVLGQFNRVAIVIFTLIIVFIVNEFPAVPVATVKDAFAAVRIELPLVYIFCHILSIRPQRVPHVNTYVVAM
jgi:hypothetical protein